MFRLQVPHLEDLIKDVFYETIFHHLDDRAEEVKFLIFSEFTRMVTRYLLHQRRSQVQNSFNRHLLICHDEERMQGKVVVCLRSRRRVPRAKS